MKVDDEAGPGNGAFSFATKEQVSFTVAGRGGAGTPSLDRNAGIAPGDEDQVRAMAGQRVDVR